MSLLFAAAAAAGGERVIDGCSARISNKGGVNDGDNFCAPGVEVMDGVRMNDFLLEGAGGCLWVGMTF